MKTGFFPKVLLGAVCCAALSLVLSCSGGESDGERLQIPTTPSSRCLMLDGDYDHLAWNSDESISWEAPLGDRVLFSLPLPEGERFEDYGLLKFDLKIEHGVVDVMAFVERPGEKRRLYRPIDITVPREGWQTIHCDLAMPEIVRESHFEAESPRLSFNIWAVKTGYPEEKATRKVTIKNVRLTKRHLDVAWDGVEYTMSKGDDGSIVYEYPVEVTNLDDSARTVAASVEHMTGSLGIASISPASAKLEPGESGMFTATLNLNGKDAADLPLLYCEWFRPAFSVAGVADSEEGILRSSDRIELPLIIMPEEIDNPVILFDNDQMAEIRERYKSTDWGRKEGDGWIRQADRALGEDLTIPDGPGWAAAYYFCHEHRCPLQYEGPDKHKCPVGGEYRDVDFMGVDLDRDHRTNQHSRMFTKAKNLALAFMLTGRADYSEAALKIIRQYREKYFTWDWLDLDASTETVDKGRVQFAKYMEAVYMLNLTEAYDILKGCGAVDNALARDLEQNFFIPIAVEMSDYRMGSIHRQQAITKTILATGLACEHAPQLAFAVASDRGILNLRRQAATSEGIAHGHGYANPTRRQFEMTNMLGRIGVDYTDQFLKRLAWGSIWWTAPFNPARHAHLCLLASKHYPDPEFRANANRNLIDGEAPAHRGLKLDYGTPPSVNFPNSGLSILRRPWGNGTLDAEFKWGMPDNRGSFSMLSLGFFFGGYRCQSYPGHFPWGSTDLHHEWQIQSASHATIVVDKHNQSGMKDYIKDHYMPHASKLVSFEEGKNASSALAFNDRMYPGVEVWRAVSVLDGACLVIDLLRSDEEHVYDRWFHGVPDKSNGLEGIGLDMKPRTETLGETDGYEMVTNFHAATTDGDFRCDWNIPASVADSAMKLSLMVLNDEPLEAVHGFEWSRQFRTQEKEFLLMRRTAKNADFIALFEPRKGVSTVKDFVRFEVRGEDGSVVGDALGVNVTVQGRRYEIILNPGGSKVKTAAGTSDKALSVELK